MIYPTLLLKSPDARVVSGPIATILTTLGGTRQTTFRIICQPETISAADTGPDRLKEIGLSGDIVSLDILREGDIADRVIRLLLRILVLPRSIEIVEVGFADIQHQLFYLSCLVDRHEIGHRAVVYFW